MIDTASAAQWWAHALGFGMVATLICAVVLTAVEFLAPYAFLSDYPQDIRDAAPEPNFAQKRAGVIGGIVFMFTFLGSVSVVTWAWGVTHAEAGFVELALMAFVVIALFTLFDILILDWLIICTWRPRRLIYPGTEGCAGWGDYGFHLKEQLRPRAIAAVAGISASIGLVVWLLT